METRTIDTLEELQNFSKELLELLSGSKHGTVVTLTGDLGAGKTALTKAIARELGIGEDVTSPTFVIMKQYGILGHSHFKTLVHIDAYRIEHVDEMRVIRFSELLEDAGNLIVIEWPERIASLIPENAFPVTITITSGEERSISYGR